MEITYCLPCRNDVSQANDVIERVLKNTPHNFLVIDDNSDSPDAKYIVSDRVSVVTNSHKQGIVASWNQLVEEAKTDYVVICTHKIRPTIEDFIRMEKLLCDGFGLVATYSFGFFGFSKYLMGKIGLFDSGFTQSNFEDDDTYNELFAHDIAFYTSLETPYMNTGTTWKQGWYPNKDYYDSKWSLEGSTLVQLKNKQNEDSKYRYLQYPHLNYKPFSKSIIKCDWLKKYWNYKYESRVVE